MNKIRFTHKIMVPNNRGRVDAADGYAEEMEDVTVFRLTQQEYDDLRRTGGLFDYFDSAFGTIIDDCEEDRLTSDQVKQAIEMIKKLVDDNAIHNTSGLNKVLESLMYAKGFGTFWEIVNGVERW